MTVLINEVNSGPATTFELEGDLISQSVAGNYSVVRMYLGAYNGPGGSTSSSFAGAGVQAGRVNGTEFGRRQSTPFLPSGYANGARRWRLGPYDVQVPHRSDGVAPTGLGGGLYGVTVEMHLVYGSISEARTASIVLPTIARATQPAMSPNPADAGSPITIDLPRASSGFTHDLLFAFGNLSSQPIAAGVGTSYEWTPPLSLLEMIPDATSGALQIGATTKSGSSTIGYKQVNGTLRVPASAVPTVTAITATDENSDVATIVGKYVQSLSRPVFSVTAEGIYGSTIATREVTIQGATAPTGTPIALTQSGNLPVTGRATDSRGRTGTTAGTLAVLPYVPPSVSAYQVRRSNNLGALQDDGAHLRVDLTAAIASLLNGTERNAITVRAFTRPRGGSVWTPRNVITPSGTTYNTWFLMSGGAIFAPTSSYDIRVQVHDKFGSYAAETIVSTAAVALDLNGTKVGVGKVHEQGTLDVAGDIYTSGEIRHRGTSIVEPVGILTAYAGTTAPTGWLLCDGSPVSRTVYAALFAVIGTAYGIGNGSSTFNLPDLRGRIPVGRDPLQTEFDVLGETGGAKAHTLTTAEMPSHNHPPSVLSRYPEFANSAARTTAPGSGANWGVSSTVLNDVTTAATTGSTGGGGAHNNLQPYVVVNHIIKAL